MTRLVQIQMNESFGRLLCQISKQNCKSLNKNRLQYRVNVAAFSSHKIVRRKTNKPNRIVDCELYYQTPPAIMAGKYALSGRTSINKWRGLNARVSEPLQLLTEIL